MNRVIWAEENAYYTRMIDLIRSRKPELRMPQWDEASKAWLSNKQYFYNMRNSLSPFEIAMLGLEDV